MGDIRDSLLTSGVKRTPLNTLHTVRYLLLQYVYMLMFVLLGYMEAKLINVEIMVLPVMSSAVTDGYRSAK